MRRIKEIILLLVLFIVSLALYFVFSFPSPFVAGSDTAFVGGMHYLRLLLNDETFFRALINTLGLPFISSIVLVLLSALILKNAITLTRKSFYLTAFAISFIISIVYLITNAALYNLLGYIFFPMSISFLCLIVFWIIELIIDVVKNLRRKRNM